MANKKPAQKKKSAAKQTSAAAKKATAPKQRAQAEAAEPAQGNRNAEILGLLLIAIGVLLGFYLYSNSDNFLAKWIHILFFASCGTVAYALPVVLVLLGAASIVSRKQSPVAGSKSVIAISIILITAFVHACYRMPFQNADGMIKLWEYIQDLYGHGVNPPRTGGGIVGGVICYVLQLIGGNALCWVALSVALAICLVLLTRISLRTLAEALGRNVRHALDRMDIQDDIEIEVPVRQQKLYIQDMQDDKPKKAKKGKPLFVQEIDADIPQNLKPRKKSKVPFDEAFIVPMPDSDEGKSDSLDFLPLSGRLQKRTAAPLTAAPDFEPVDDVPFSLPSKQLQEEDLADFPADPKPAPKPAAPEPTVIPAPADDGPPAYVYPLLDYLTPPGKSKRRDSGDPEATARLLESTLASFNISAKVVNFSVGPVVTRFELQPAPGVRVNRITTLSNDIALALAARRVRIEAPIPGKAAIGIEIPNKDTVPVVLRDIIGSPEFKNASSPVTMALGKDIAGKIVVADLGKMPHMLIAGSTGSGKSVCINDLIISMVYKSTPDELRMILIDPKVVELSVFATLPHLLIPVVTEPKKASSALRWAVNEMTMRYKKFSELGARDLARFNILQADDSTRLPKIVVIIDELADLMMVAPDEVEDSICRIAQLGRASGIHLIVATQRPSADIITGLIKANIPSRCSFAVSSAIDSRIILDRTGAEKLLGRGDMLFHPNGAGEPVRLQCAFVSDEEVERVTRHFKTQEAPVFDQQVLDDMNNAAKGGPMGGVFGEGKQEDDLLGEAVRIVLDSGQASISMIQRRLRVGYARAARLIDIMEQKRYVSEGDGSKPRKVLISRAEFYRVFEGGEEPFADVPDDEDEEL